jgi:Glycosyl transferase family 11
MNKIVVRIKGGLGNQLFCYAAARRLTIVNGAELVIDASTGFARDFRYQRQYSLDHFCIPVRKATSSERLEPFERYRRGVMKWLSLNQPFSKRSYLEQEGLNFDDRLLNLKVKRTLYLDGGWQSEQYFKDVEEIIREDLRIIEPQNTENHQMTENIINVNAVAVHIRWFHNSKAGGTHNLSTGYYQNAIKLIEMKIDSPHYFVFSDDPVAANKKINFPEDRVTFVTHNRGDENAYADMWLMSQCQHFIIANSTFSWWGAWLSVNTSKIVIAPSIQLDGEASWGFKGLIPDDWIKIS